MMIEKCNIVYSHSQCTERQTVTVCRMLVLTLQSASPVIILFCTGYDSESRPLSPSLPRPGITSLSSVKEQRQYVYRKSGLSSVNID